MFFVPWLILHSQTVSVLSTLTFLVKNFGPIRYVEKSDEAEGYKKIVTATVRYVYIGWHSLSNE